MVSSSFSVSSRPVPHRRSCSPSSVPFQTGWFQRPFALHRWTSKCCSFLLCSRGFFHWLSWCCSRSCLTHPWGGATRPSGQIASFDDAPSITPPLLFLLQRDPGAALPALGQAAHPQPLLRPRPRAGGRPSVVEKIKPASSWLPKSLRPAHLQPRSLCLKTYSRNSTFRLSPRSIGTNGTNSSSNQTGSLVAWLALDFSSAPAPSFFFFWRREISEEATRATQTKPGLRAPRLPTPLLHPSPVPLPSALAGQSWPASRTWSPCVSSSYVCAPLSLRRE